MIKPLFSLNDFKPILTYGIENELNTLDISFELGEKANKIYMDHLEKNGMKVFGRSHGWTTSKWEGDAHSAILIEIEPLVKEPCKHDPTDPMGQGRNNLFAKCRKCGVELKAKWEEVKNE